MKKSTYSQYIFDTLSDLEAIWIDSKVPAKEAMEALAFLIAAHVACLKDQEQWFAYFGHCMRTCHNKIKEIPEFRDSYKNCHTEKSKMKILEQLGFVGTKKSKLNYKMFTEKLLKEKKQTPLEPKL